MGPFDRKRRCTYLAIISCRQLRYFFSECGRRALKNIEVITLVNPTDDGMESLAIELRNKTIETNNLNVNTSITPSIAVSLSVIMEGTDLEALDLSHCYWDRRSANIVAKALPRSRNLKRLDLSHCRLEDSILASILSSLQHHPTLREINISYNTCLNEACGSIGAILKTTRIECLKMAQLFIGREKCLDLRTIAENISGNKSLKMLDLEANVVSYEDLELLIDSLTQNKTLQSLNLAGTDISQESLVRLSKKLQATNVETLCLRHNPFKSAEPLVEAAIKNYRLRNIIVDESVSSRGTLWFYTALNCAGRELMTNFRVPPSLWARVLKNASCLVVPEDVEFQTHDIIFFLLNGLILL